jgi:nicotinamide mononucleotide transporter
MVTTVFNYLIGNLIEILGFLFGIVYVILAIRENFWCWMAGIVNVLMYIIVFYQSAVYGMMGLQVIYLFMSVYGLVLWSGWLQKKSVKEHRPIVRIEPRHWWIYLALIAVLAMTIGWFLNFTDNTIPWMDGLTTSMGLVATWMTAKKYIESWLVWIVSDLICVGLYAYIGLTLTMVFYIVLFAMAIVGYFQWRKNIINQSA